MDVLTIVFQTLQDLDVSLNILSWTIPIITSFIEMIHFVHVHYCLCHIDKVKNEKYFA